MGIRFGQNVVLIKKVSCLPSGGADGDGDTDNKENDKKHIGDE
jgi:hypothetical protein